MGEADDPDPAIDRIHSGATTTAFGRTSNNPRTYNQPHLASSTYPPPGNGLPGTALHGPSTKPGTPNRQLPDEKRNVNTRYDSASSSNGTPDVRSKVLPPPAPPPDNTKEEGSQHTSLTATEKLTWPQRAKAGSKRFINHTKNAITHSWLNVLLIFVPIGIAVNYAPIPHDSKPTVVFAMNAVAIVPLAGLLAIATESVASRMGDTWASLLNVTFGNAVELIIFILALAKDQIPIVQASILGSILANLLLILGMAFLLGGLRFREQIYNSTVTQMSAVLLCLAVTSLLLPTAFHASFSNYNTADDRTVKISRGVSVVLLLVYVLYLLFQLKSHAYMYESTPQNVIDEESHPGVLAGMMDSSSSDSSSSSSSDSDSSVGSHITAAKRIKRAIRHRTRRKSNASSTIAPSSAAASSPHSPSPEARSAPDNTTPNSGSYFAHNRRDTNQSSVFSGDEADTDGENGGTRVRDFEDGQKGRRMSVLSKGRKDRKHHKKDKKDQKSRRAEQDLPEAISESPAEINEKQHAHQYNDAKPDTNPARVDFATETDGQGNGHPSEGLTTSPRRPFAITRQSFRPPMPSVFTNTVFTTPAPAPSTNVQPGALSIARGPQLRRTNSLPDRLNRQASKPQSTGAAPPDRLSGTLPINEVDVIGKDRKGEGKPPMSKTASIMLLLVSTGLVAFCAELLVDAIPEMIESTNVSQAFIGLIILPIVGNAAEHVTAVVVATKNKMDLAIGIALGSSIQIALFITPVVVLLGWILEKDMSLLFTLFETISLFVTVFVVNFLVLDGRSNYLEGSLLIAGYVIIAVCAFFYPSSDESSAIGGGPNSNGEESLRLLMRL